MIYIKSITNVVKLTYMCCLCIQAAWDAGFMLPVPSLWPWTTPRSTTPVNAVFVVDALLGRSHEAIHARFQAALLTGSEKLMISAAQTQTNLDNLQTICRDLQTLSVRTNITSVR